MKHLALFVWCLPLYATQPLNCPPSLARLKAQTRQLESNPLAASRGATTEVIMQNGATLLIMNQEGEQLVHVYRPLSNGKYGEQTYRNGQLDGNIREVDAQKVPVPLGKPPQRLLNPMLASVMRDALEHFEIPPDQIHSAEKSLSSTAFPAAEKQILASVLAVARSPRATDFCQQAMTQGFYSIDTLAKYLRGHEESQETLYAIEQWRVVDLAMALNVMRKSGFRDEADKITDETLKNLPSPAGN